MFPVYKDKNTREGEEKGEAAEMVLRDQEILSLCRARDQRAIAALAEKYGAYCHTVAHNILGDHPDAEECVNDAYLAVWNGVPSAPPRSLLAYLAKVTRNIALKRLEHNQAQKRGDRFYLLLDELAEVLPGEDSVEDAVAQQLKGKLAQPGFLPALDGFHPEIAAHFYAGAVLALIRWWLEHDMPVSDEVLLGHLEHFIPDVPGGKG